MTPGEELIFDVVGGVLWLALLNGWLKASVWLLGRNSRIAIVAGGILASVPGALAAWALCIDWRISDTYDRIFSGFWMLFALLMWVGVVKRLRQLRPVRIAETPQRPALPKPPARPLLPRRPDAARIETARLRIAGRRQ